MTDKRFTVAVYDENSINGFTVLDLEKPNSSKRLKYENVYIGSKVGCEIVCNFGNSLAEENEQLKQSYKEFEDECQSTFNAMNRKQNDLYRKIFKLKNENEQLQQYKQSVNDVLRSWSQKNLTAKQLQVVLAIMEELNVIGDVE